MGIIRNFIDIIGISSENDLPHENKGQIIEYSDTGYICIPEDKASIDSIYQIAIDIELKSTREINTPFGKAAVLDGLKKFKIIYGKGKNGGQVSILNIDIPFNSFVDLNDRNITIENINIFLLDAYFQLIDPKKIYSHFLYLIDVHYNSADLNRKNIVFEQVPENHKFYDVKKTDKQYEEIFPIEEISISNEEKNVLSGKKMNYEITDTTAGELFDIDSEYL